MMRDFSVYTARKSFLFFLENTLRRSPNFCYDLNSWKKSAYEAWGSAP
jgi:hypothetical protein